LDPDRRWAIPGDGTNSGGLFFPGSGGVTGPGGPFFVGAGGGPPQKKRPGDRAAARLRRSSRGKKFFFWTRRLGHALEGGSYFNGGQPREVYFDSQTILAFPVRGPALFFRPRAGEKKAGSRGGPNPSGGGGRRAPAQGKRPDGTGPNPLCPPPGGVGFGRPHPTPTPPPRSGGAGFFLRGLGARKKNLLPRAEPALRAFSCSDNFIQRGKKEKRCKNES